MRWDAVYKSTLCREQNFNKMVNLFIRSRGKFDPSAGDICRSNQHSQLSLKRPLLVQVKLVALENNQEKEMYRLRKK